MSLLAPDDKEENILHMCVMYASSLCSATPFISLSVDGGESKQNALHMHSKDAHHTPAVRLYNQRGLYEVPTAIQRP